MQIKKVKDLPANRKRFSKEADTNIRRTPNSGGLSIKGDI